MRGPKVGIYMSCYNHEPYVREAMDSIVGQTYKNWELYIVNDASTDATGDILATYQDERIHYYDFKENTQYVGAANFLQSLLRDADVDYIAVMSSDDKWELDKLEKQVKILVEHPEYKACFTWDKIIYSKKSGICGLSEDYSHKNNMSRYDWIHFYLFQGNRMNACSALVEKQVFYEVGRMNQFFLHLGDFRLWMRIVLKYPIYILCEELTYYRRHGDNLSEPKIESNIQTLNEFFWLFYETIDAMPPSVFFRTFYGELPYVWDGSEEDVWAAKFILLAGINSTCMEQVAMTIFFRHCENEKFLKVLEDRYFYKAWDFFEFTRYGGIQYSLASLCQPSLPTKNIKRNFSAGEILMRYLQPDNFEEVLKIFRHSALCSLFEITGQSHESNLFLRIKSMINTVHRRVREQADPGEGKVLVLIAEDSEWDVENGIEELQREYPSAEFLAAFVPSKKNMFSLSYTNPGSFQPLGENVREFCLYDCEEHCLRFPEEKGESVDVVWYVDCLGEDYECEEMALGYPLRTEQNAILKKSICDKLETEATKSLYLLDNIKVYG